MNRREFGALAGVTLLGWQSSANAQACDPVESGLSQLVTAKRIARFAPQAAASIATGILARWADAIAAEIVTPVRIQHFFTQIATETGGLRRLDENMRYTAERLLQVFPKRVTREQAYALHLKPIQIANHVYGDRLGNVRGTNDGWNFRGSGYIQLTGRGNFERVGKELGLSLVDKPDDVRDPRLGFKAATIFWTQRKLNAPADRDDLVAVRRLVNGGTHGLASAKIFLARARAVFKADPTEDGEVGAGNQKEFEGVQLRLEELGYLKRQPDESFSAQAVTEALMQFQDSKGLAASGLYDDDTLSALTDPEDEIQPD